MEYHREKQKPKQEEHDHIVIDMPESDHESDEEQEQSVAKSRVLNWVTMKRVNTLPYRSVSNPINNSIKSMSSMASSAYEGAKSMIWGSSSNSKPTEKEQEKQELPSTQDFSGHYWTELDDDVEQGIPVSVSYGWWPSENLGESLTGLPREVPKILGGVPGELNAPSLKRLNKVRVTPANQDPHHGEVADISFHPKYTGNKSDGQIRVEIERFAHSYSGQWNWKLGWGQNCQTFQTALMNHVGLTQ